MNLTAENLTKWAIAGGLLYAMYRFAPSALVKTAVVGVAGVAVAKQIPFVSSVI